jgi:hypothetical protein
MIARQNGRSTQWQTEKWLGDRRLPSGYIVNHVLDSNGSAEIVAWAPQRDRAEQIARIPELEVLASIGERLALALGMTPLDRQTPAVRRLLEEFEQVKMVCREGAVRKSTAA